MFQHRVLYFVKMRPLQLSRETGCMNKLNSCYALAPSHHL